ncbi:MAG: dTDP-4-dehydrorhamnose reductase [Negativicutes bacterium]|nr:dTDP-4-dehydrorhamnose reductase [Negativicutes bacterium]
MQNFRPRILLIGRNGQIGWELERTLAPLGDLVAVNSSQLDLGKPADIRSWVTETGPQIIVNAAAYTAVDKAETDRDAARAVNAAALEILGEEARKAGAAVFHYSTDYVFDGRKAGPYVEDDPVDPINFYGETKLAGERALAQSGARYVIFRTSWVYGLRGKNFLQTILRLAKEQKNLTIVNDQTGAPTWSRLIAEATALVIAKRGQVLDEVQGIYHLTCQGRATWYEFAQAILAASPGLGPDRPKVLPITSAQYPTPAKRPEYSVLDNGKLTEVFAVSLPAWQDALQMALTL